MNDIALEMEERLKERITLPHKVRVMESPPRGMLHDRSPFIRAVLKQYTLDHYDEDSEAPGYHYEVQYTVHPSALTPSKRSETLEMLEKNLDELMAKW